MTDDKFVAIGKLAEAAMLIQEASNILDQNDISDFADDLQDMMVSLADIGDAVEETE
jgi:hypothetical protein